MQILAENCSKMAGILTYTATYNGDTNHTASTAHLL
ncbi:hypothetical protein ABH930_007004 [Kitasatospora sp. GAS204A]|nr:hypothetical protein [Kitasatospora sp. GAS204B]